MIFLYVSFVCRGKKTYHKFTTGQISLAWSSWNELALHVYGHGSTIGEFTQTSRNPSPRAQGCLRKAILREGGTTKNHSKACNFIRLVGFDFPNGIRNLELSPLESKWNESALHLYGVGSMMEKFTKTTPSPSQRQSWCLGILVHWEGETAMT